MEVSFLRTCLSQLRASLNLGLCFDPTDSLTRQTNKLFAFANQGIAEYSWVVEVLIQTSDEVEALCRIASVSDEQCKKVRGESEQLSFNFYGKEVRQADGLVDYVGAFLIDGGLKDEVLLFFG